MLSPKRRTGFPTAFTNGGTSFTTREHPPTKAWRPMRTNWCTAVRPATMTLSSTVTCPASCELFTRITPSPTWQSCARCTYDITNAPRPMVVR